MKSLLLAFSLLFTAEAGAVSLYVAPNGVNTNPGTLAAPFATLQKAHNVAVAGDIIYMRGGTYLPTAVTTLTRDGVSGSPITVTNYQNEVPILDGSSLTGYAYVLRMSSASWWHIKGIEITKGPEGGLSIEGTSNSNIIERLNIHHNGRTSEWEGKGIVLYGSGANNLFLNNDSYLNQDLNLSNADGFQIATTGAGNVLRGNRAWGNSDDGFDFFNVIDGTHAGALTLENNWSFKNGWSLTGAPGGDGQGFKLGGKRSGTSGTSGAHVLKFNMAWANRNIGFDENAASKSLRLENNTSYNNGTHNYGFWDRAHTFIRNIAFGTGVTATTGTQTQNSWQSPYVVSAADFVSLSDTGTTGPRKADGSLPDLTFMRLVVGSDLVGLGAFPAAYNPPEPEPEPVDPLAAKLRMWADQIDAGTLTPGTGTILRPSDGSVVVIP